MITIISYQTVSVMQNTFWFQKIMGWEVVSLKDNVSSPLPSRAGKFEELSLNLE